MRYTLSLALIAIIFSFSHAQGYEIMQSENLAYPGDHILDELVMADTSGYYVSFIRASKKETAPVLRKYDNEFTPTWTKQYAACDLFYGYTYSKDFIFRIGAKKIKKKEYEYFVEPINKEGKAYKQKVLGIYSNIEENEEPFVISLSSPDTTQFGFIVVKDSENKKNQFHFAVKIFDNELRPALDRKFNFKQAENLVEILSAGINNKGGVFVVTKEYEADGTKNNYVVNVYMITTGSRVKQIEIPREDKYYKDVQLTCLENGETAVTAIYENTKQGKPKGYHFLLLDQYGNTLSSSKSSFPIKARNFIDKESSTATVGRHILRKDGTILFTLEENYYITRIKDNGMGGRYKAHEQISRNIITIEADDKGDFVGMKNISKLQINENPDFNSHKQFYLDDHGLFLLYNDNPNNLSLDFDSKHNELITAYKASLFNTLIKNDGEVKRVQLLNEKQTQTCFLSYSAKEIGPGQISFLSMPETTGRPYFQIGRIGIK